MSEQQILDEKTLKLRLLEIALTLEVDQLIMPSADELVETAQTLLDFVDPCASCPME